jgi:F-type H+-transporting ATPase subunit gamma
MASIRELRRKVKSVKSTQQITKAMKLVAAARLNKAQERILMARPFANKMENLLHELAYLSKQKIEAEAQPPHPFMVPREGNRIDLVVVTADRGLCGGFNANLIRKAIHFLRDHKDNEVRLWVIGKKGRDYFRRFHMKIEKEYVGFFQRLGFEQAEILAKDMTETFLSTPTREVVILYNAFKSRLQSEIVLKTLLPIPDVLETKPTQDFLYEPSKEQLVDELMPRYLSAQLFRILLESQSAELAARMAAMDNATNNASDLIFSLTLTMNKVRQAQITKELSEIVSGAEALQSN